MIAAQSALMRCTSLACLLLRSIAAAGLLSWLAGCVATHAGQSGPSRERIKAFCAVKETKRDCVIWLSCSNLNHPHLFGSRMLREVDWLMNEHPDPSSLKTAERAAGPSTRIVQCLCGWGDQHDASRVIDDPSYEDVGLYGFAQPDETSFAPITKSPDGSLTGNARNIEIMRNAFLAR